MSEANDWVRVASVAEVAEGGMLAVEMAGEDIAIYRISAGEWAATSNICTHAFAMLTDGYLEDGIVECPLHAGRFDCRTGQGLGDPIEEDLKTYRIKAEGDDLFLAKA